MEAGLLDDSLAFGAAGDLCSSDWCGLPLSRGSPPELVAGPSGGHVGMRWVEGMHCRVDLWAQNLRCVAVPLAGGSLTCSSDWSIVCTFVLLFEVVKRLCSSYNLLHCVLFLLSLSGVLLSGTTLYIFFLPLLVDILVFDYYE